MKPIKIAILGFGKIAEDQHVPSIAANPRFELVATSSRHAHGVRRSRLIEEPAFRQWALTHKLDFLLETTGGAEQDGRLDHCTLA